jgi:hypothetical protein
MARRGASSIHRGFFYNWGRKKAAQEAGQARLQIYKDGTEVMSFDDDGTDTSGDSNGPQTKLNQSVTTTGDVTGLLTSPRVASSVDAASVTAFKAEPMLKGTNSLSGDYRAIEINLDDTGSNTVAGDAVAIRIFSQFNVNPGGDFAVMEVEAQGDTGTWDYFLKLPADGTMAASTGSASNALGRIKVKVASKDLYILLYSSTAS